NKDITTKMMIPIINIFFVPYFLICLPAYNLTPKTPIIKILATKPAIPVDSSKRSIAYQAIVNNNKYIYNINTNFTSEVEINSFFHNFSLSTANPPTQTTFFNKQSLHYNKNKYIFKSMTFITKKESESLTLFFRYRFLVKYLQKKSHNKRLSFSVPNL